MPTILLVDDDDEFRAMLSKVLTRAGFQVQEATDGQQAIELYGIHASDLVITDLVMPEKEGLEMIMEFKRLYAGSRIIAISGEEQVGPNTCLQMAKALGAQRVLAKPFSDVEILEVVSEVLKGSEKALT